MESQRAKTNSLFVTMPSETARTERTKVVWNSDTMYALGLCRALGNILGIWPLTCENMFSKMRFLTVAILEISMMINLAREIMADCVAVGELVNFLALVGCSVIAFLKVTVLRINRKVMELVIKSAMDDWSAIENPKARNIMMKHARTGRFVFIFQMGSALLTIVPLVLASLPFLAPSTEISHVRRLENSASRPLDNFLNFTSFEPPVSKTILRSLPMGTGCFVIDIPTISYILVYVLQVIQLLTTCAGNVGTDVYFFVVTTHVCGQLELLKMRFEAFGKDTNLQQCLEEIGGLVKRHNHLMKLSNDFEATFNTLIFAQLSANALHMSLLGIQVLLSIKSGNGVVVVGALIAFYVLSLQLFLYSYAGDYLSSQIESIRYATYCCQWYNLPRRIVKDLLFVMSRSNRPFNLTAGKVYSMNMDNFKNIFKAMGSYFSVLKIMFDASFDD